MTELGTAVRSGSGRTEVQRRELQWRHTPPVRRNVSVLLKGFLLKSILLLVLFCCHGNHAEVVQGLPTGCSAGDLKTFFFHHVYLRKLNRANRKSLETEKLV